MGMALPRSRTATPTWWNWNLSMGEPRSPLRNHDRLRMRIGASLRKACRVAFGREQPSLSPGVVLAHWRKDVEHLGVRQRGSLVFDAAGDQKAVAGYRIKHSARMLEANDAADDVHHLLVRVAVACAHPALLHRMPHHHHGGAVGQIGKAFRRETWP